MQPNQTQLIQHGGTDGCKLMRAVGSCLGKFDLWALYKMSIGSSKLSNQYRILIADKEPFSAWASTCDS